MLVDRLFNGVWTEDTEIDFIEIALAEIPNSFKDENGVPKDCREVRSYLYRMFAAGGGAAMNLVSDNFIDLFREGV